MPKTTALPLPPCVPPVRLEIDSVVVADSTGAESVGVSTLLGARPDPFCAMESCWLQHMEAARSLWVLFSRLHNNYPKADVVVTPLWFETQSKG